MVWVIVLRIEKEQKMASLQHSMTRAFTNFHVFLYRTSGGKIWNTIMGSPILLLTTIGRKTGLARTTPVVYVRSGDEYLIAASAGGADTNPTWYNNLASKPEAKIEIGDKKLNVKVIIAAGEERDRLYELFKAQGKNFIEYEQKTTRKIPAIRLQLIA
jgi:deazaflavin-dependent oxidoreductase (nitroreductase family)